MEPQVNVWLSMNAENFRPEDIMVIRGKMEKMDANQFMIVQCASFEKPSTILLIAILLGWERLWLDDRKTIKMKMIFNNIINIK
jgi:hypothetical protein